MHGLLVPATFLRDKLLEMRQRHQKYEDTPYSLEPNCKESPGALRDLQVIGWVTRAAGLGLGWNALVAGRRDRAARGSSAAAPRDASSSASAPGCTSCRQPARRPAGVRPAAGGARARWAFAASELAGAVGRPDAALLPGGEGDHAALDDPAAVAGAAPARPSAGRGGAASTATSTASTTCSTCAIRTASSATRNCCCGPS